MEQSNEEKLVRHCKAKDIDKAIEAALFCWLLSGFILLCLHQEWAYTEWGFFGVGVPYLGLLIWGAVWGTNQKYK